eukprot:3021918-Pyramimonas_sp.AAC.1
MVGERQDMISEDAPPKDVDVSFYPSFRSAIVALTRKVTYGSAVLSQTAADVGKTRRSLCSLLPI